MEKILKQIKRIRNNLFEEVLHHNFNLVYKKDFNEQDQYKIATKLLENQAFLLQFLYEQEILSIYCKESKSHPLKEDLILPENTKEWNLLKKDQHLYFSDLVNMVEMLVLTKPPLTSFMEKKAFLIYDIFTLRYKLIHSFKPLVLYYAKQSKPSSQSSYTDLQQEGFLGLIQALENFYFIDPTKSLKSYFSYYIKHQIRKSVLENQSGVRVPYQAGLKQLIESQKDENSHYESDFKYYYFHELTEPKYYDNRPHYVQDHQLDIDESLWNKSLNLTLKDILSSLSDIEQTVIKMRYGFDQPAKPYTLEFIGKELHLTKERVRQIEKQALMKMRSKSKNLLVKEDLSDEL